MRIVIVPDKFKGAASAAAAASAIADGIRRLAPTADLRLFPMADGGDGTLDCLLRAWGGRRQQTTANGPYGDVVTVPIGLVRDATTAIVEMATVCGHGQNASHPRNPLVASTYGLGQVLRTVIDTGVENILVGLGGTATVDGGAGMMQALGLRFLDGRGREIPAPMGGGNLPNIARITWRDPPANFSAVHFTLAVDVLSPLCGPNGAARLFGPQKGASTDAIEILEAGLSHWADVLAEACGRDPRDEPGIGAAGGVALPLLCLGQAEIVPGVDLVIEAQRIPDAIAGADLVITGEGRLDRQSLLGKVVGAIARLCQVANVDCVALVGEVGSGAEQFTSLGIQYRVIGGPITACESQLANAAASLLAERLEIDAPPCHRADP